MKHSMLSIITPFIEETLKQNVLNPIDVTQKNLSFLDQQLGSMN